ncbi:MAG: prepilin-type N-terminal cleavage/methylation domain-containing protein [Candidatus Shapirobacteria bacterium]|nr:prepilin-type N-terminal cleavage/methylation domain-containing protein [Candidatus Shapirobacteria bacterium]MDD4410387.1 prepilin-type N-terminal cleavage/methylation domain-containing protein [Candidatus Shapirobacteria bacterium]
MKNRNAFTLIELLVAITIGMLVVGFGSVALNDFNEKQKVEATRQELLSNLRLARNYAITNQLGGATKIVVSISQSGVIKITDNLSLKTFLDKDISPNGIIITAPTIYFSVSDGRSVTNATPLVGATVDISIATNDNSTIKNIKIDESGLIYE